MAALLLAALAVGTGARADEPEKVPRTAEDHLAMASLYQERSAAYRKEAASHRDMAVAYRRARPDLKGPGRNPWTVKMEKHCGQIARAAAKLAVETEKAADYHALRAKELQGE